MTGREGAGKSLASSVDLPNMHLAPTGCLYVFPLKQVVSPTAWKNKTCQGPAFPMMLSEKVTSQEFPLESPRFPPCHRVKSVSFTCVGREAWVGWPVGASTLGGGFSHSAP